MPRWIAIAAVLALLAVAAGAFGAHALKSRLDEEQLRAYETAVRYQLVHAVALLVIATTRSLRQKRAALAAAIMFTGVLLFSGSIYGLVLAEWRWLGPVTPLGGALMMLGWIVLACSAAPAKKDGNETA